MKQEGRPARRWSRRAVAIALTLGVVAALVWLNWKIAMAVRSQELEDFPTGVEAEVDQQHEALITETPGEIALVEQMDFERDLLLFEDVQACFAGGRLEERTIKRLERRLGRPPPAEGWIELLSGSFDRPSPLEEPIEERCRTRIEIASADEERSPLRIRAFTATEATECGMGGRALRLRAEEGALRIRLSVVVPPGVPSAVACRKFLLVGDFDGSLSAPFGLEIEVPPGGEATFRFSGIGDPSSFAPVDFDEIQSVELVRRANDEPVLHAQGLDGEAAVRLDRLALLSNGLGVALTGKGPIAGDDAYLRGPDFQDWLLSQIKTNPFLSLLVGGLLALLSQIIVTYLVEKPAKALWQRVGAGRTGGEQTSEAPEVTPPPARESPSSPAPRRRRGRRFSGSPRP